MIVIFAVLLVSAAFALGYVFGRVRSAQARQLVAGGHDTTAGAAKGAGAARPDAAPAAQPVAVSVATPPAAPGVVSPVPQTTATVAEATTSAAETERAIAERARIIRSYESETARLRADLNTGDAAITQLQSFAAERRRQFAELAQTRADIARYRQIVVDLENNAPSLLFGPGAPDDLKLIVGVGPVLERMLHQLGVGTYRQIAHWSERDIDDFDARLPEFPGRIRRDGWVTQARALHQAKYGEVLPVRGS